MNKRWHFKKNTDAKKTEVLSQAVNINETLAALLLQRNITNFKEAKSFFRPSLNELNDPFLMKDMGKAVSRLINAIQTKENILIYGDYDVDGTTSVALCYSFLRKYTENISYYIPDRYKEGYGVSEKGIDWAIENNFKLIITLDCGIKAHKVLAKAQESGIDVIVCDHHKPGDKLPKAYAILNPKRIDCSYPYKELSGCGVGFKLLQGFCNQKMISFDNLYDFIDLVAVSIAADIVPMTQENRILAYYGLEKINTSPLIGLKALIDISFLKSPLTISNIVFGIAPRINAAGRIDHAHAAVELLTAKNLEHAQLLAHKINQKNEARRKLDESITEEALQMIQNDHLLHSKKSTVLFKSDWHKGVIGIVASRCIEHYYRPTIILTESNKKATGSARSILGFDLYDAISACSDLLEQYGGHTHAAGLTMKIDQIEAFQQRFEKIVQEKLQDDQLVPTLEIDQAISLEKITFKFYNIIKQMAPFGPGNRTPVFASFNVQIIRFQILKEEHLKIWVQDDNTSYPIEGIGFNLAKTINHLEYNTPYDIVYTIEENNFRGQTSLQLRLKDIQLHQVSC